MTIEPIKIVEETFEILIYQYSKMKRIVCKIIDDSKLDSERLIDIRITQHKNTVTYQEMDIYYCTGVITYFEKE
jgi:hypothetical protein